MLGLLLLTRSPLLFTAGEFLANSLSLLRPESSGGIDIENVIQSQVSEKLLIARVRIHHTETAVALFYEVESRAGQSAQKGGVHHGAVLQIHHEILGAFIEHRLKGTLHLNGILETATSLHTKPKNFAYPADENGGGSGHGRKRVG
jgi:hypothetical protein